MSFARARDPRWSRRISRAVIALGVIALAVGAAEIVMIAAGRPSVPRDLFAYIRAGDALRAGMPVYTVDLPRDGAFLYSPVWAVLFAAISWLPPALLYGASIALNLACLRYVAGSWRYAGLAFLWPFTAFVVAGGNIDLPIAAALVAAWRYSAAGRRYSVAALVLVAAAKLSPIIALPVRRWREALIASLALGAITLPWWHLWPEWVAFIIRQPSGGEFLVPIPWWTRVPVAVALLALRRPWAAVLAAVVATPALYLTSTVLLLAPLRVWLDGRTARGEARSATTDESAPAGDAVAATTLAHPGAATA